MFARLRNSLLATVALLAVGAIPASAVGPISSNIQVYSKLPTYSATIATLTTASSATDIFTITGSATKTVTVYKMGCTGTSTAAASQIVTVFTRTVADTGGTATNPVVLSRDSTDPAGTAVVAAYTANPTIAATGSFGAVFTGLLQTPAPASIGADNGFFFSGSFTDVLKPITLRGVNQQAAISFGGVSGASGLAVSCTVTWTES